MGDESESVQASQIAEIAGGNSRLLYRVAYGIVRDAHVAEDVCQGALLHLIKRPSQLRDAAAVRSWLVRSVVNGALQHRRRAKIEAKALQALAQAGARVENDGDDDFLQREKLLDQLDSLDPDLRDVVVLRVMESLSGVDVHRLLGHSASDVSRRLHAGLARLRAAMQDLTVGELNGRDR